jgi:predicted DNA-binding protein
MRSWSTGKVARCPAGVAPKRHRDITMTAEQPDKTKNMLLRLDPTLAEQLQAVAQVEGRSISDVAREAIAALVEQRRSDQRFLKLLDDNLARHQRLLRLLRDDQP